MTVNPNPSNQHGNGNFSPQGNNAQGPGYANNQPAQNGSAPVPGQPQPVPGQQNPAGGAGIKGALTDKKNLPFVIAGGAIGLVLIIVLCIWAFSSKSVVGTWEGQEDGLTFIIDFNKDGTCNIDIPIAGDTKCTWTENNGEIAIDLEDTDDDPIATLQSDGSMKLKDSTFEITMRKK